MTLIECFSESHVDNLAACLRLRPEKLILVGSPEQMRAPAERYQKLLKQRGYATKITLCDVQGKDLPQICSLLDRVIREAGECVIDLTGGDAPVVMAVGAALAGMDAQARKGIRVEKFDRSRNAVVDCMAGGSPLPGKQAKLTVEELIAIHGGCLHPAAAQLPEDFGAGDLDGLWSIVTEDPKDWNNSVRILNELESHCDSQGEIELDLHDLRGKIANLDEKEQTVRRLLDKLQRKGIVEDYSSRDRLAYAYRTPTLRYCVQKAGNVLEVKTLLEGKAVLQNGAPLFQDCRMSVSIDWDGVLQSSAKGDPQTRNEIDVICMHGTTPLFISCKNGDIEDEELYKLHTVAGRFGGPYARKMLIATNLDRKGASGNLAFARRAWDMDILLVTDAGEMSRAEWRETLEKAVL